MFSKQQVPRDKMIYMLMIRQHSIFKKLPPDLMTSFVQTYSGGPGIDISKARLEDIKKNARQVCEKYVPDDSKCSLQPWIDFKTVTIEYCLSLLDLLCTAQLSPATWNKFLEEETNKKCQESCDFLEKKLLARQDSESNHEGKCEVDFVSFLTGFIFKQNNAVCLLPILCDGLDNDYGDIAVHLSILHKKHGCLQFLLNNGCTNISCLDDTLKDFIIETRNVESWTLEFENSVDTLKHLLPFISDKKYQPILQFAAQTGNLALLPALLFNSEIEPVGIPPYESFMEDLMKRDNIELVEGMMTFFPNLVPKVIPVAVSQEMLEFCLARGLKKEDDNATMRNSF